MKHKPLKEWNGKTKTEKSIEIFLGWLMFFGVIYFAYTTLTK